MATERQDRRQPRKRPQLPNPTRQPEEAGNGPSLLPSRKSATRCSFDALACPLQPNLLH